MKIQHFLLSMIPAGALFLVGCDDPAHRQQVQRRGESAGRALKFFGETEHQRGANLAYLGELAHDQNERDKAKTTENPHLVGRQIDSEFQRFHDRQPEYQQRIGEQLRGKPETIERTLPHALY